MSWNAEYAKLKAAIAGKFKTLKDYKDYARKNKELKLPVSPDLYFKARGMEVWNAKDFLGEYDESKAPATATPEKEVVKDVKDDDTLETEDTATNEDEELHEEVKKVVEEMQDVVDGKVEEKAKSWPKPTTFEADAVQTGNYLIVLVRPSLVRGKLKERFIKEKVFEDLGVITTNCGLDVNILSGNNKQFMNFVAYPDSHEFSVIREESDDVSNKMNITIVFSDTVPKELHNDLVNMIVTSKNTGKNIFTFMKDKSEDEMLIMSKGDCIVYV